MWRVQHTCITPNTTRTVRDSAQQVGLHGLAATDVVYTTWLDNATPYHQRHSFS